MSADLPTWVLDLVYRLDRAEGEHPKLYRYKGPGPFPPLGDEYEELDTCYLEQLLAMVPADVLNGVRFAARWQPTAQEEGAATWTAALAECEACKERSS